MLLRGLHHEFAGQDEDFLRGERQVLACRERGQRRLEPRRADHRDEHDVGAGELRELDETGKPAHEPRAGGKRAGIRLGERKGRGLEQPDVADIESARNGGGLFPVGPSGDPDELELIWVGGNNAQRVLADRSSGTEEDNAFARA